MKWVDEGEASEVMWLESPKSNIHGAILLPVEEKGLMSSKAAEDDELEDSGPKDGIICWSCATMMDWIRNARSEAFVFLERTACWALASVACGQCWGWPGHQCGPFGWRWQSLFQLFAVFSSYKCERICLRSPGCEVGDADTRTWSTFVVSLGGKWTPSVLLG